MSRCAHCRSEVPADLTICPACRAPLPTEGRGWITIARLTNLAEAGYFADLLADEGVECKVLQYDRSSAMEGDWTSDFYLQAATADAERAATCLQRELERASPDDAPFRPDAGVTDNSNNWRPLVLVLLAGGMAYAAGHAMFDAHGGGAVPPRRSTLWKALGELPAPLESPPGPGQSGYRLRHDPASGAILLEEDRDGDGRYDIRQTFRQGQLVEER